MSNFFCQKRKFLTLFLYIGKNQCFVKYIFLLKCVTHPKSQKQLRFLRNFPLSNFFLWTNKVRQKIDVNFCRFSSVNMLALSFSTFVKNPL